MTIIGSPQPTLPSGFTLANARQRAAFEATGSVHGASKVTIVGDELLAIRMRPPRTMGDILSAASDSVASPEQYRSEYEDGWRARPGDERPMGKTSAFDDGFLDRAEGHAKWHSTYCADHDECA